MLECVYYQLGFIVNLNGMACRQLCSLAGVAGAQDHEVVHGRMKRRFCRRHQAEYGLFGLVSCVSAGEERSARPALSLLFSLWHIRFFMTWISSQPA